MFKQALKLLLMAVAFVSSVHTENVASATSIGIAKTVAAGNLVVVGVTVGDGTTIASVTDGTTTVTVADTSLDQTTIAQRIALYSFPNHAAGSSRWTATFAATQQFRGIEVAELSGAHLTSPLDGTATGTGTSAAPLTANVSPAPVVGDEYIVGLCCGTAALTSGGPFTDIANDSTLILTDMEGKAIGPPVASACSWTQASGAWGAIAATYKPPALVYFYLNNPVQGGSNAGLLDPVAPTASTSTTGWTVGTTAVNQYSRQTYNSEIATTGFTSTAQPSGTLVNLGEDCYRSAATSGTFSAGTWYSSVSAIAVSSGGIQHGRARTRIWRSSNADGTSATEITQGTMIGSQVTELSTTVAQTSSASTQITALTLTSEYLFYQIAWETL